MTPGKIRLATGSFVALCVAIVVNTLFLQNDPAAIAAAKLAAERAAVKAKLQRLRSLSIDSIDRKGARQRVQQRTRFAERKRSKRPTKANDNRAGRTAEVQQDAASSVRGLDAGGAQFVKAATVRAIQRELSERKYRPGRIDGVAGLMTRAAIMAYEADHGLPLTGEPSEGLLQKIIFGDSFVGSNRLHKLPARAKRQKEQVIRTVQQSLARLGYLHGPTDGALGEMTRRAIKEFEMDRGLAVSGRISGRLIAELAKEAGRGRVALRRPQK